MINLMYNFKGRQKQFDSMKIKYRKRWWGALALLAARILSYCDSPNDLINLILSAADQNSRSRRTPMDAHDVSIESCRAESSASSP